MIKGSQVKYFNKVALFFYTRTWIFTLLWSYMVIFITLYTHYDSCWIYATWLYELFLISLIIFGFLSAFILIFTFFQTQKIRNNIEKGNNKYDDLDMLVEDTLPDHAITTDDTKKILILPLYYLWIYALSKIIIFFVKETPPDAIKIFFFTWIAILIFSLWLWIRSKKYVKVDESYSIKYTLLIAIITLVSIYWNYITPYIADIIRVVNCVLEQIVSKNITN